MRSSGKTWTAVECYPASVSEAREREWTDPCVAAYAPGIDETLLVRNLLLSVEQRFVQLLELQRFADELRRAGHAARQAP